MSPSVTDLPSILDLDQILALAIGVIMSMHIVAVALRGWIAGRVPVACPDEGFEEMELGEIERGDTGIDSSK
jgi:hypothetical protein